MGPDLATYLYAKLQDSALESQIFTLNLEIEAPEPHIVAINDKIVALAIHIFTLNLEIGTLEI